MTSEKKILSENLMCIATVVYNSKEQHYIGFTAKKFKTRYYEHMHSFRKKNSKEIYKTKLIYSQSQIQW